MIHGDYDADGVTSTVAMVETIQALGGVVEWYVPDRFSEGYGLRTETIKKFIAKNVKLLITVDCGSTNVDEIAVAREAGMEVIVIDHHHQPAKLPNASAIINPVFDDEQYPFRYHASAGVVFTVVRALLQETKNGETLGHPLVAGWEKWLLDIVAIATVADMMPIKGENRLFVHYGLKVLARTRRPGLRALISAAGVALHDVDEVTLGFHIGPRLNAAGRLQHASTAVKLLLTTDPVEAESLARELQQLNDDRKSLTELATNEAWDQIQSLGEAQGYAVFAAHWSAGVLGLIAGRLADRLGRPVFVMTQIDTKIVGSGRAGGNLDIMEIMNAGKAHFAQFGGHTGACGFTLQSDVSPRQFHEWLVQYMNEHHPVVQPKELHLDIELPLSQLTPELLSAIDRLAPFGLTATRPVIYLRGVDVRDAQRVGGTKQHLRLRVHENGVARSAIGFRLGERHPEVAEAATIDLAVEPSWNEWQGKRDIQLRIIDIRPTTYGTISA
jgi:single-stranded-DNA-specific exonuclease